MARGPQPLQLPVRSAHFDRQSLNSFKLHVCLNLHSHGTTFCLGYHPVTLLQVFGLTLPIFLIMSLNVALGMSPVKQT